MRPTDTAEAIDCALGSNTRSVGTSLTDRHLRSAEHSHGVVLAILYVLAVRALARDRGFVVTLAAVHIGLGDDVRAGADRLRCISWTQLCAGWGEGQDVGEHRCKYLGDGDDASPDLPSTSTIGAQQIFGRTNWILPSTSWVRLEGACVGRTQQHDTLAPPSTPKGIPTPKECIGDGAMCVLAGVLLTSILCTCAVPYGTSYDHAAYLRRKAKAHTRRMRPGRRLLRAG